MRSAVDEIKSRVDIVDLITESGVQLRRSGRNYMGFCPFHDNKRTPSFAVWPDSGRWYCFGECGEGGDIFNFVMKKQGMDFREALEYLAQKAGVDLSAYRQEAPQKRDADDRLYELLEKAALYYHDLLLNTPAGAAALRYLREERGLLPETITRFELGYAPEGWDNTLQHFSRQGYSPDDLLAVGLVRQRQSGKGFYDTFRHRLMIPIRDHRGRVVGFGARALAADETAKYINSPQTELFDKGRLLYGLYEARQAIRQAGMAVIVEGYMDVIGLHQAGYQNAVAPMGTALTADQIRLLKRYSRKVVLALDPDEAGRKAILRGLDSALEAADEREPRFNARGFLQLESGFGMDLRVMSLPEGLDPDELVLQDRQRWQTLLAEARPIVQYVMETLVAEEDVRDPKRKAEVARQVLPLIAEVVDPVEQAAYRQRLARLLGLDEQVLLTLKPSPMLRGRTRVQKTASPAPRGGAIGVIEKTLRKGTVGLNEDEVEAFILNVLYASESFYWELNRLLREAELPPLETADFQNGLYREAFLLLLRACEQIEQDWKTFLQEHATSYLLPLLRRWMRVPDDFNQAEARAQAFKALVNLRRERINRQIQGLSLLAEENGLHRIRDLSVLRAALDRALAEREVNRR